MEKIVIPVQMLLCPICEDRLDESCKKFPCRCQPSYCRTCLRGMHKDEKLKCPTCRESFSGRDLIEVFPKDLTLLNILEQSKKNPSESRKENAAVQVAAITNSLEDLLDKMMKQNGELHAQLAMSNLMSNVILKNAQDITLQRSKDEETFKKEIQSLRSDKEKLEFEIAVLKFEQKLDRIIRLLNNAEWSREVKREVQNVLNDLKQTKVAQSNDSVQKRIRDLLESLEVDEKLEITVVKTRGNVNPRKQD